MSKSFASCRRRNGANICLIRNNKLKPIHERSIEINADNVVLHGDLQMPENARAIILFAHGSGSSRKSTRNQFVARKLNDLGLATLLLDLLTESEEEADQRTGHLRFDIGLLADRLSGATNWLKVEPELASLPIGYFGASTGAAAALAASVRHPSAVQAVVSRGGRPDLAETVLERITAPTLLIVGGKDDVVVHLNEKAKDMMHCETTLETVEGATHLFEEPGALDEVTRLAGEWFVAKLAPAQKGTVL
jgi:putative phosphoribosyl transferase